MLHAKFHDSFPLPKEAPHEIWLWLAKWFQRRRCLNIVDGRTMTMHGYTISSPFEPYCSDELKNKKIKKKFLKKCTLFYL